MVAWVAAKNGTDRRSRLGVAPAPDGELGLAESSGARHIVEMRARRMLEARIKFVGHPDFDDSTATAEILGPMPGTVGRRKGPGKARAREALPLSDADFQDSEFLTREQEVHLFRKMNFHRSRRNRFTTGREKLLEALTDRRDRGRADTIDQEQSRYMIRKMLSYLDGREQAIIVRRFGLAGDKQTIVQVGRELGISKERVRQLESRALDKLRTLAEVQKLDPTDESA